MRRDLEKDVVGLRIKEAEVKSSKNAMRVIRRHKTRKDFTSRLVGHKITKVERRGKYVLMTLDSGDVLVVHFGMSGQFQRGTGRVALPPHTHVVLTFQQRGDLRFVDPRTFGEMFVSAGRRPRQGQGAAAPRDRPARPGVHVADVPVPAGRPRLEDEAAADGPEVHLRARQHLLRRGAVPRGHPVRPHERRAVVAGGPPPLPGDPGGAAGGDQAPRHDARRRGLRRPVRRTRGSTGPSSRCTGGSACRAAGAGRRSRA